MNLAATQKHLRTERHYPAHQVTVVSMPDIYGRIVHSVHVPLSLGLIPDDFTLDCDGNLFYRGDKAA